MDYTRRRIFDSQASARGFAGALLYILLIVVAFAAPSSDTTPGPAQDRNSIWYFRHEMWRTVSANNPYILPVARAIRAVTTDPLQQLVMVNDVTHLLVDYDSDMRVYGMEDFHATLNEMIARRRAGGWAYLRDDCDGQAVFAAHLLASLGIPWHFAASYWKQHAWVVATVNGVNYDLLDLLKSPPHNLAYRMFGHYFVRPSHPPPSFDWRDAWAVRTHSNLKIGLELGMLTLNSTKYAMQQRHATDWTEIDPHGKYPPPDKNNALFAGVAGFPYGEPLFTGALAAAKPKPTPQAVAGNGLGAASRPN